MPPWCVHTYLLKLALLSFRRTCLCIVPTVLAPIQDDALGDKGQPVQPTSSLMTLKGAMGSWRPGAVEANRNASGAVARNPPVTVTGVAPWALQPLQRQGQRAKAGVGSGSRSSSLKRPLPRAPDIDTAGG